MLSTGRLPEEGTGYGEIAVRLAGEVAASLSRRALRPFPGLQEFHGSFQHFISSSL